MTAVLEGVSGQQHAPAALYRRERPGAHCTAGWVGPRAGLDAENLVPTGIRSRTVQPVVSRYTDWATPAHKVGGAQDDYTYLNSVVSTKDMVINKYLQDHECAHSKCNL